jgi:hypothetical protein
LKGALLAILEGMPLRTASSAAASRVLGAVADPRGDFGDVRPGDRSPVRPAEARDARNRALLSELLSAETIHGRSAVGIVARRHETEPAAIGEMVKHLCRLRQRQRTRNSHCERSDIPNQ